MLHIRASPCGFSVSKGDEERGAGEGFITQMGRWEVAWGVGGVPRQVLGSEAYELPRGPVGSPVGGGG